MQDVSGTKMIHTSTKKIIENPAAFIHYACEQILMCNQIDDEKLVDDEVVEFRWCAFCLENNGKHDHNCVVLTAKRFIDDMKADIIEVQVNDEEE